METIYFQLNMFILCLLLLYQTVIVSPFAVPKKSSKSVMKKKHIVDISQLQDLIDAGTLNIIERREDYKERRENFEEPQQIYVIGTSHVSEKSAEDVYRAIEIIRPQSVVVELCKARAGLLMEKETIDGDDSDRSFMDIVADGVSKGVGNQVLFQTVMTRILTDNMGSVKSGMDIRAANRAAKRVKAEIVLGDRPIQLTLRKAWESLSIMDRIMMVVSLMGSLAGLGKNSSKTENMVALAKDGRMDDDVLDELMKELTEQCPSLIAPLVTERDAFLAWSLKRSKAVNGKQRVVGVMGRAHTKGVIEAIRNDNGGDTLVFQNLV